MASAPPPPLYGTAIKKITLFFGGFPYLELRWQP